MNLLLLFAISVAFPASLSRVFEKLRSVPMATIDAELIELNKALPQHFQLNPHDFKSIHYKEFEIEKLMWVVNQSPLKEAGTIAKNQVRVATIMESRMKELARTATDPKDKAIYQDLQKLYRARKARYKLSAQAFASPK